MTQFMVEYKGRVFVEVEAETETQACAIAWAGGDNVLFSDTTTEITIAKEVPDWYVVDTGTLGDDFDRWEGTIIDPIEKHVAERGRTIEEEFKDNKVGIFEGIDIFHFSV